jgi:transposase-like protein
MYTSAARRAWLAHYEAMGANVAQTCRHYGISRATFYKWRARYDPAQPQKPLRSRSRRPRSPRKATWTQEDLKALSTVCVLHPTWGRRRLHALLRADNNELPISERTVGRMLQRIKKRCPVCRGRHGRHAWWHHPDVPATWQDRAQSSPPTPATTTGEMQPVLVQGLDTLVRAWAAASPEARRLFRQQHAAAAETAAPRRSSAETEQHAKSIAALFQKQ